MRIGMILTFFVFLSGDMALAQGLSREWKDKNKLIVVTTADWNATQGTLVLYERKPQVAGDRQPGLVANSEWKQVSEAIPVVLGRGGLAWDPALIREHSKLYAGPVKREGDGRSPAGVFDLKGGGFGFAPSLPGSRSYMPLTPTIDCVDDPASVHYGRIVDRARVDRVDWSSSERMRSVPGYRWGVIVNYNLDNPVRGEGSCIFLHEWNGPTSPTAGCTAMAPNDIETIVRWVKDPERAVLVQIPEPEYQRVRKLWRLP